MVIYSTLQEEQLKLSQNFLSKVQLKTTTFSKRGVENVFGAKLYEFLFFFIKHQSFNQFEVAFNKVGSDIGIMFTTEYEIKKITKGY